MRQISIEGLPQIGAGATGRVYRLNDEQIVKVYNRLSGPLEKIMHEKSTAKRAFVHGIPTAISFDTVQVGDQYGIIYEMIDSCTLGSLIKENPDKVGEYAHRMAEMLKKLHTTVFEPDTMPDARETTQIWVDIAERGGLFSGETLKVARRLIKEVPAGNTFVHGDFHPGNIMVSKDEYLLIDLGDAGMGDPLFDLMGTYHILKIVTRSPGAGDACVGAPNDLLIRLWELFIREYTGINDPEELAGLEKKYLLYGLIRNLAGITIAPTLTDEMRVARGKRDEKLFWDALKPES